MKNRESNSREEGNSLFETPKLPLRHLDEAAASAQLILRPEEIRAALERLEEAKTVSHEILAFEFSI